MFGTHRWTGGDGGRGASKWSKVMPVVMAATIRTGWRATVSIPHTPINVFLIGHRRHHQQVGRVLLSRRAQIVFRVFSQNQIPPNIKLNSRSRYLEQIGKPTNNVLSPPDSRSLLRTNARLNQPPDPRLPMRGGGVGHSEGESLLRGERKEIPIPHLGSAGPCARSLLPRGE